MADINELFKRFMEDHGGYDGSGPVPTLPLAENVRRLKEAHLIYGSHPMFPPNIKEGDIIRGKKGYTDDLRSAENPHIVLELLDKPYDLYRADGESIGMPWTARRYDMVMGTFIKDRNGSNTLFVRYYADRRDWELHPDGQKLNQQHS